MIVDGYVRVSRVGDREGEHFISPDVQREQIEAWGKRESILIAHIFEELDESGARADRPLLGQAIARVESGDSEGVAVAYISRFGRSLLDGLAAIDRITKAGGVFVSVEDGLDFASDTGRLVMRLLFSISEWERDRSRANWATARKRAVARGAFLGTTPYGYRRRDDRRLAIDPRSAPVVAELFRRRALGAHIVDLRRWLTETGAPTATGASTWDVTRVRSILRSRAHLGESRHGDFANPTAHAPIVDLDTWELAQESELRYSDRGVSHPALLSGILRCAACQRLMVTGRCAPGTSDMHRRYSCPRSASADPCPSRASIIDSVVEPYVEAVFWQCRPTQRNRPHETLQTEVERREHELTAYRDNPRLPSTIGPKRFADGLAVRVRRVAEARVELSRARAAERRPPSTYRELRERWPSMTLFERRAAFEEVIACVFVDAGKRRAEDRLHICLRREAPPDLPPYEPSPNLTTRPFDPLGRASQRGRETRDWDEDELRETLNPFLAGSTQWPSFPEFQAAGLAIAYLHVQRQGGQRRWAKLMGLPYRPHPRLDWTDDRIRRELSTYLSGRTVWPRFREFHRDGRRALRRAITYAGGPERWAAETGVALPSRSRQQHRWSYIRMKSETARFTAGRSEWPTRAEFGAAALHRLYFAIMASHVRDQLATELGLRLPSGRVVVRARWTEPAIAAALDVFLNGRVKWPTQWEFKQAGLGGLWNRLDKSGTHDLWRRRYGFQRASRRAQQRHRAQETYFASRPEGD